MSEEYELLRVLHWDEWLAYRDEFAEAVYAREGMGLFELHAAGRHDAVREAVHGGLMFAEWVVEVKSQRQGARRL